MQEFFANGKLLLTGEYVVLDGATAIGLPTVLGQQMQVEETSIDEPIRWQATLGNDDHWFYSEMDFKDLSIIKTDDIDAAERLAQVFKALVALKPDIFQEKSYNFQTQLDFPRSWGLGSSSTLIALLSKFSNVDAFKLVKNTFNGSGYDVSCAILPKVQTYQLTKKDRKVSFINLHPDITQHLYFVHLNQKQNSREGIKMYRSIGKNPRLIKAISDISKEIIGCESLEEFEDLLYVHESLLSDHLEIPTVHEKLFGDYKEGVIKSLGAWGGDFVLVSNRSGDLSYFQQKGFETIIPYQDLIVE